jgi:hypothetical protein
MLRNVLNALEEQVRGQEKALASLQRDVVKKRQHIDNLKKMILEMDEGTPGSSGELVQTKTRSVSESNEGKAKSFKSDSVAQRVRDAARKIITEAGKPMTQQAIKEKMDEMGLSIGIKNPVDTIRIYLNRAPKEFRRVDGQGYIVIENP